ncbi:HAMP domain-containing histidine kinase [Paenibacillus alginolyticus]|uniref:sensor histidine kinase n=1 Tax=Paenibacillus alginolyticus TaxID=59839 RepID=UPI0003F846F0|nr:HAMP domain-containing sensor histidine kinase [Paenibacillus alginolyticus]MCY9666363.1 HAMP domain-containing histidine kinase [Paenibacillus alginolyticus]
MTLRTKLSLMYSLIFMITLVAFGTTLYLFLHKYIYNDIKKSLAYEVNSLNQSMSYELTLSQTSWNLFINFDEYEMLQKGYLIQITNFSNGLVTKSNNLKNIELPVQRNKVQLGKPYFDNVSIYGTTILVYTFPLVFKDKIVGTIQSGININQFENFFKILRFTLYMLTLSVILLTILSGIYFSKIFLSPIHLLIQKLDQIRSVGELAERIYYNNSNDEIGKLALAINSMLDSLQGSYTKINNLYITQQRFIADASHELRTPLTSILGNAQLLKKVFEKTSYDNLNKQMLTDSLECINDIVEESDRMRKLVGDLLHLARSDSGINLELRRVELKPVVESVVRKVDVLPKRVDWFVKDLHLLNNIFILGNSDYLQQLLLIFIENAFKYTLSGAVELYIEKREHSVGICIKDTGIGLDTSEIPYIFDRFYRADNSRGQIDGTGLGLSIAKFIIDEHKASVDVTSFKGKGSTFTLWFNVFEESI